MRVVARPDPPVTFGPESTKACIVPPEPIVLPLRLVIEVQWMAISWTGSYWSE